jgi:hypothetical protein
VKRDVKPVIWWIPEQHICAPLFTAANFTKLSFENFEQFE